MPHSKGYLLDEDFFAISVLKITDEMEEIEVALNAKESGRCPLISISLFDCFCMTLHYTNVWMVVKLNTQPFTIICLSPSCSCCQKSRYCQQDERRGLL